MGADSQYKGLSARTTLESQASSCVSHLRITRMAHTAIMYGKLLSLLVLAISMATAQLQDEAAFQSPPYYPAPKGGWAHTWTASYFKAQKLVELMTLAEKVNITTGVGWMMGRCVGNTGTVERLGFPSLCANVCYSNSPSYCTDHCHRMGLWVFGLTTTILLSQRV